MIYVAIHAASRLDFTNHNFSKSILPTLLTMYLNRLKTVIGQLNQLEKVSIKNSPCTLEEISYFEKKVGLKFPKAYEEYLLWDGRNQGIFGDDYASADDIDYNREIVNEMLQEINVSGEIIPNDAIIFYVNHGAYSFAFIRVSEGDNPPATDALR